MEAQSLKPLLQELDLCPRCRNVKVQVVKIGEDEVLQCPKCKHVAVILELAHKTDVDQVKALKDKIKELEVNVHQNAKHKLEAINELKGRLLKEQELVSQLRLENKELRVKLSQIDAIAD